MTTQEWIRHVSVAITTAEQCVSDLTPEVAAIPGFIGAKSRHLFRALGAAEGLSYLEIGTLHGASLLSLTAGRTRRAVAIDDFRCPEWEATAAAVRGRLESFAPTETIRLLERDCWEVPLAELGEPFDIFYYDGDHSEAATARAYPHFLPVLRSPCLLIVDDYSWPEVAAGVRRGLTEAGLRVAAEWSLFTTPNDGAAWWNGLWLGVVTHG